MRKKPTMNALVVQGEDISCFARILGDVEPENKESAEYRLWKSIVGGAAILFVDLSIYGEFITLN